ncbi:hypothetical protein PEC18_30675 [Paucibacter sp. O1-1]|nr:hypothetical protein [Paucibacter sp. O1-1]MDA3830074.1 hypothetical protein [Paucibacter sp. O1-1]
MEPPQCCIKSKPVSPDEIATRAVADNNWQDVIAAHIGFTPTAAEYTLLDNARMQGNEPLTIALRKLIDVHSASTGCDPAAVILR